MGQGFNIPFPKSLWSPSSDSRYRGQSKNSDVLVQGDLVIHDTKVARRRDYVAQTVSLASSFLVFIYF